MEEIKTLDEQFDDLLHQSIGKRLIEVHHYSQPIYRNEIWPSLLDGFKRIIIGHVQAMIEKVNIWLQK